MSNSNNVTKYKKPLKFNMGIFIFGMIFIYFLAFGIFRFFKNGNVTSYVVNEGSLSDNVILNGFAIRNEEVYNATGKGSLHLYAREGTKVSYGESVFSLDENGAIKAALANISTEQSNLSDSDFKYIQNQVSSFKASYDSNNFSKVYDLKLSIESNIIESLNLASIDNSSVDTSKFILEKAQQPGIVVYSCDGYEKVTLDSFTKDMLNSHNLSKTVSKNSKNVENGDFVYKLITSEEWQLLAEIDDKTVEKLKGKSTIQVRFTDDSQFAWVNFEIINREGSNYIVLSFPNSVIRYCKDRFVKIEIQTNDKEGLKIPKSAVVNKTVYKIPIDYLTSGGNSSNDGFIKKLSENNSSEFVEAYIVTSDKEYVYVETNSFDSGITLIKPSSSSESYVVEEVVTVPGVYNINKGYAKFVGITIEDDNNDYCIITPNSRYGIKRYDYIALYGDKVKDDEIIR